MTLIPLRANTIGPALFLGADYAIGGADGAHGPLNWQGQPIWMTLRYGPDPWVPSSFMPTLPGRLFVTEQLGGPLAPVGTLNDEAAAAVGDVHARAPGHRRPTLALAGYLAASGRARSRARGPTIAALPGGRLQSAPSEISFPSGKAWVLKQALPKLRVPVDWFADPARTHREARAIQALGRICPSRQHSPADIRGRGEQPVAMEAVGDPHENWKSLLLQGRLEAGPRAAVRRPPGGHPRGRIPPPQDARRQFADRSFFRALRLEPYYSYTRAESP